MLANKNWAWYIFAKYMQIDALWKSYIQTAQFEPDLITMFSALLLLLFREVLMQGEVRKLEWNGTARFRVKSLW